MHKAYYEHMTYPEYLKSEWWQLCRGHALWAADYRCQTCGREGVNAELHVHHIRRNFGDEKPWEVTVLCSRCHEAIEDSFIVGCCGKDR